MTKATIVWLLEPVPTVIEQKVGYVLHRSLVQLSTAGLNETKGLQPFAFLCIVIIFDYIVHFRLYSHFCAFL